MSEIQNTNVANVSDNASNAALMPRVDVIEDKSGIRLFADMAGVDKDKLTLQIDADTLTIEASLA